MNRSSIPQCLFGTLFVVITIAAPANAQNCPAPGDCCLPHENPGCQDPQCCDMVCQIEPFCCDVIWEEFCAQIAQEVCEICGGGECFEDPDCEDGDACTENFCEGGFCIDIPNEGTLDCFQTYAESPPDVALTCPGGCEDCGEEGLHSTPEADSVYLFSGESYTNPVDLQIAGRGLNFTWARKYRSRVGPSTAMGNGWDFSYNIYIQPAGPDLILHDGNSRQDLYFDQGDGTWLAPEFFRELQFNPDTSFTLTFPDTGTWDFFPLDGSPAEGKISSITERNGNTVTFEYDAGGLLTLVGDSLNTAGNREIGITYNVDGFVESVTDFVGRTVTYDYYEDGDAGGTFGDLKSVTTPAIVNTPEFPIPPGHEYPAGKKTVYTYTTGFGDERLNHDLLTITDPKGQTYLTNVYAHTIADFIPADPRQTENPADLYFDRLVRQYYGDQDPVTGDIVDFVYEPVTPDPENNFAVIRTIVNDRVGNVRVVLFDDAHREVIYREYTGRWDPDLPTFDTTVPDISKLRAGDPDFFDTKWLYNPDAMVIRVLHPNENWEELLYDELNDSRRSQANVLQHCRFPGPLGGDQDDICELFEYDDGFGGCCGSNFVTRHVDGRGNETLHEYDDFGNRTHTQHRIPSIVEDFEYNDFGQLTIVIHPDNGSAHRRVDRYAYFSDDEGPQNGYLKETIVDDGGFELKTTYEYDIVGNLTIVVNPRGHDSQTVFNQLDQVVREVSRETSDGSGVRYVKETFYDPNDNVVRIDIPNVDADDNEIVDNPDLTTVYEYDILNVMTRKCEESGAYDGAIPGTQEVPKCGGLPDDDFVTEVYEYDPNRNRNTAYAGEASEGRDPFNIIVTQYDERDLLYRKTRAPGHPQQSTQQYDYDGNRNTTREIQGLEADGDPKYPGDTARVRLYTYDGYDRLWGGPGITPATMDPMGNTSSKHYDPNGNLIRVRDDGELIDIPGDAGNDRLHETTYEYDPMDRMTRTIVDHFDTETQAPVGDGASTTERSFSDNSQIIRVINDNNHAKVTEYDTANRITVMTDAKNNKVTYGYDPNNSITVMTEIDKSDLLEPDDEFTTTYEYDNLDRMTRRTDNVGNTTAYRFDSRDNEAVIIDGESNETRSLFDGLNRVIKTVRDMNGDGANSAAEPGDGDPDIVTRQLWDDNSRLTEDTDDNANTTSYQYDALDRLVSSTHADGTVQTSTYDTHDNPYQMTDANGSVVESAYDRLDRVRSKDIAPGPGVSDDTTQETYRYDGFTRTRLAEDDDSRVKRSYDSLSNVIREVINPVPPFDPGDDRMTTSLFDGVGNRRQCVYPSGRAITCTFDALERIKTISDAAGSIATYQYVGPDRVERREFANGTATDYTYDGITGEPNPPGDFGVKQTIATSHSRLADQSIIDAREYRYDRVYNKILRDDLREDGLELEHSYEYDSIYRLTRTIVTGTEGGVRDTTYDHDGVGNRTLVTGAPDPGPYLLDPTLPDPGDFQLNQYSSTPFDDRQYDRNGNLTARSGQADILYDYRNRMVQYDDLTVGQRNTYSYDPLGRRIGRIVDADGDAEQTLYFYDQDRVCEEQDDSGGQTATYVYGLYIDEVLTMTRGGAIYYYHADDNHNVMAITGVPLGLWSDNFDSYALGQLPDQSTWEPWDDDPGAANFVVTDGKSHSPPHSVAIDGPDDAVHRYSGYTSGQWVYSAWVYVPVELDDVQNFILLNTYPASETNDWSLQLEIDGANNLFADRNGPESLPLIKDDWSHIVVLIDLDLDEQTVFYDDNLLLTKSWTAGVEPGGALEIAAVDLFANGSAHNVFYDDIILVPQDNAVVERYEYGDYGQPQVLESIFQPPCPQDLDGSGAIDFGDILKVLSAWGNAGGPEDLDGSGTVDFGDLLVILANWGGCPEGGTLGNPYLFTGRRFDPETGWYYYRARYLDPRAGRFLSRDPIGMWSDPYNIGNAYAYVGNNPFSYVDPYGLVTVKQHSFKKKTCGGFDVKWVFTLDKAAPCDGYIVQQVDYLTNIKPCKGKTKQTSKVYWEAWKIKKGDKQSWDTVRDKWTDNAAEPSHPATCGNVKQSGSIKFFCQKTTGDLGDLSKKPAKPNDEWAPGGEPMAGALPSTTKKPKWWGNKPANKEKVASREAGSEWDCCVKPPKNKVWAKP